MSTLYIVQETTSLEVIGVYDTFESAKIAGEIWTREFIIVEKNLNSPPAVDTKAARKTSIVYEHPSYTI